MDSNQNHTKLSKNMKMKKEEKEENLVQFCTLINNVLLPIPFLFEGIVSFNSFLFIAF